jgi:hypothetical protein
MNHSRNRVAIIRQNMRTIVSRGIMRYTRRAVIDSYIRRRKLIRNHLPQKGIKADHQYDCDSHEGETRVSYHSKKARGDLINPLWFSIEPKKEV